MNNWEKGIEELQKKRENLAIAGGLDRIAKQHASGKLTARERLEALFDDGSFAEINDIWVPAITNIGVRPTVTGGDAEPLAETHRIGWSGDLSGALLPVTLCKFIRAERRFPSLDALSVQIQRDIHASMRLLPAEGNAAVTESQSF